MEKVHITDDLTTTSLNQTLSKQNCKSLPNTIDTRKKMVSNTTSRKTRGIQYPLSGLISYTRAILDSLSGLICKILRNSGKPGAPAKI